jgi:hypothetical protein
MPDRQQYPLVRRAPRQMIDSATWSRVPLPRTPWNTGQKIGAGIAVLGLLVLWAYAE